MLTTIGTLVFLVLIQYFVTSPSYLESNVSPKTGTDAAATKVSAANNANLRSGETHLWKSASGKCSEAPDHRNLPALFSLKTKLGVSYDGSHWFHMAENFMAQHSALRASGGGTNRSTIYFNFDEAGFVKKLNGVTKLMVALAVLQRKQSSPVEMTLHFVHYPLASSKLRAGEVVQLPQAADMVDAQTVNLSADTPTASRFIISSDGQVQQDLSRQSKSGVIAVCAVYHGSVGGVWPTPQRGHWFPRRGDVDNFRSKIRAMCPPEPATQHVAPNPFKKRRLVIYQRDISRKLFNEEEALALLKDAFPPAQWDITVLMHERDASPCILAHKLNGVDVLLTPHGFQSMLLLFLPRPSVLFEVFPYRYYKRGYGPLSMEYGIIHGGVMSPALSWDRKLLLKLVTTEWCMLSKTCRNYARGDDVLLTKHGVNVLQQLVATRLDPLLRNVADSQTPARLRDVPERLYAD